VSPLILLVAVTLLGTIAASGIWRARKSPRRIVQRQERQSARDGMLKAMASEDARLAAAFHEEAARHCASLDAVLRRMTRRAQRGDPQGSSGSRGPPPHARAATYGSATPHSQRRRSLTAMSEAATHTQ